MLKKSFSYLLIVLIISFSIEGFAQKAKKGTPLIMKTSGQCEMCKERLETAFAYEKGVYSSEFDLKTKEFTVYYNPAKTDPDKIRKTVNTIGYDADDTKADPKAYAKLPACCKKCDDPSHTKH
jgi:mercuric ion binding protein